METRSRRVLLQQITNHNPSPPQQNTKSDNQSAKLKAKDIKKRLADITNASNSDICDQLPECFDNLKLKGGALKALNHNNSTISIDSDSSDDIFLCETNSKRKVPYKLRTSKRRCTVAKSKASNSRQNQNTSSMKENSRHNTSLKENSRNENKRKSSLETTSKKRLREDMKLNDSIKTAVEDDVQLELKYFVAIDAVVGSYYSNLEARMNLAFRPMCMIDPEKCMREHRGDDAIKPIIAEFYIEKQGLYYITESRELHFFKFVDDLTFRNIFPGVNLITNIFDIILTYEDSEIMNSEILKQGTTLLDKILTIFPPCISELKPEYRKILYATINAKVTDNYSDDEEEGESHGAGMFIECLTLLELLMDRDDLKPKKSQGLTHNYVNSYRMWEMQATQYEESKEISRCDKIDRIFFVMNFLLKILEYDFVIWNIENADKDIAEELNTYGSQPLIAEIFWPQSSGDNCGTLNENVRKMITVFVKSVILYFPYAKIKILSRALNLIAHVTLMSEFESPCEDKSIQYPILSFNITESLSREIIKIVNQLHAKCHKITDTRLQTLQLVTEQIRTPFVKMIISGLTLKTLSTMATFDQPMNCEKITKLLRKQHWTRLKPCEDTVRMPPPVDDLMRYAIYRCVKETPRKHKETASTNDYIYFLTAALKAYSNYMRIPDVIKHMHCEVVTPTDDKGMKTGIIHSNGTACDHIMVDSSLVYRYSEDINWFREIFKCLNETEDEWLADMLKYTRYILSPSDNTC